MATDAAVACKEFERVFRHFNFGHRLAAVTFRARKRTMFATQLEGRFFGVIKSDVLAEFSISMAVSTIATFKTILATSDVGGVFQMAAHAAGFWRFTPPFDMTLTARLFFVCAYQGEGRISVVVKSRYSCCERVLTI